MIYTAVGTSGLMVSRIGFGCMSLPANEGEAFPVLHHAIANGVNYLDTADIYNDGVNEEIIGKAIKGKREKLVIASKAGNVRNTTGGLDWDPSKKHILQSIEGSLRRLQTDYIDLYQLHGGTINDNIDETIEAFELLKEQGKIRYYGISSIRPNVIREYVMRSSIISVMTQYSLLDRRPEEDTLEFLLKNNIGVLVRGSVAQGLLINKKAKDYLGISADNVAKTAKAVSDVSGQTRTATQTAIQYVLQNNAVSSAVVGMRTKAQVDEALQTIQSPALTDEEMALLRNAVPPLVYKEHR